MNVGHEGRSVAEQGHWFSVLQVGTARRPPKVQFGQATPCDEGSLTYSIGT